MFANVKNSFPGWFIINYCKQQSRIFVYYCHWLKPVWKLKQFGSFRLYIECLYTYVVHTYDVYLPVRLQTPIHNANCIRSLGQRGHGNDDVDDHDHGSVRVWQAVTVWLAPGVGGSRCARFLLTQCNVNWQLLLPLAHVLRTVARLELGQSYNMLLDNEGRIFTYRSRKNGVYNTVTNMCLIRILIFAGWIPPVYRGVAAECQSVLIHVVQFASC